MNLRVRGFVPFLLILTGSLVASGCADSTDTGDASSPGLDANTPRDAGADAGFPDAVAQDSGASDADAMDAVAMDAQAMDGATPDTGTFTCASAAVPTAPGEHGCVGCVSSDPPPTDFVSTVSAITSAVYSGSVVGAEDNGYFVVQGTGNQLIYGTVPTDLESGLYSVTIPLFCGEQRVSLHWCNDEGVYAIVYRVTITDCRSPDIQVTLSWDALGDDWELHLIRPGGRINDNASDCTWTSCIGQSPDWGVIGDPSDDPTKDVDNTGAYGPENILLSGPEDGTFTVMVEHWGQGSPKSDGTVILNVNNQSVLVEIFDLAPQFVRTAATIEWPSGIVRTSTALHDCTGNWSSGCRDPIP